jgi:hypothetical protein
MKLDSAVAIAVPPGTGSAAGHDGHPALAPAGGGDSAVTGDTVSPLNRRFVAPNSCLDADAGRPEGAHLCALPLD